MVHLVIVSPRKAPKQNPSRPSWDLGISGVGGYFCRGGVLECLVVDLRDHFLEDLEWFRRFSVL